MDVRIEPMAAQSAEVRRRAAAILVEAFAGWPESWNTLEGAEEEVAASLGDDRLSFVAVADEGVPLGWIGGISTYTIGSGSSIPWR